MKKPASSASKSFRFDARDSSPLYIQLARRIEAAIRDGQYQVDQALPSERLLSDSLGVSRVTARKAIDQLVDQGLIVRRQGSGNYIAPRFEQPLSRLTSFSEELSRRGYKPTSRWLKRVITLPAPDEQLSLAIASTTKVARLERLRLADDVVMAYEISVLPANVVAKPAQVEGSLYKYLRVAIRCRCVRSSISAPSTHRTSWRSSSAFLPGKPCCSLPESAITPKVVRSS